MGPGPGTHRPGWLRRGNPWEAGVPGQGLHGVQAAPQPGGGRAHHGVSGGPGGAGGVLHRAVQSGTNGARVCFPRQVNVYVLGKTFLLLARELCINAPAIGTAGPRVHLWARGREGTCPANLLGAPRVAAPSGLEPGCDRSQGGADEGVDRGHQQCGVRGDPRVPLIDSTWQPGQLSACRAAAGEWVLGHPQDGSPGLGRQGPAGGPGGCSHAIGPALSPKRPHPCTE